MDAAEVTVSAPGSCPAPAGRLARNPFLPGSEGPMSGAEGAGPSGATQLICGLSRATTAFSTSRI